jgi:hypothetical protein
VRCGGLAVLFDVRFGRFLSVLRCVVVVTAGQVRVMRSCLMSARFVVVGRFSMVPRRVLVVFCRFAMVLCCLLGHTFPPIAK